MLKASPIRCLITAGPTREFLDPVRFLSNPSTGRMGFALARAAAVRGWTVDLVAGPVALPEPEGVVLYPVVTAEEMYHQVDALFDACDLLVMTAAVSDFRPARRARRKEKKEDAALTLELERTVDILKTVSERKLRQVVLGFAAETDHLEDHARSKLEEKRMDWIAANLVGGPEGGFGSGSNTVLLLGADGSREEIGPAGKDVIAEDLLRVVADHPRLRAGAEDEGG